MDQSLKVLFHRRAVKVFDPVEISPSIRERILDAARHAPSSFNMQPYRFFWIESPASRAVAAKLCMGQSPARTASALVVAVADLASMRATADAQAKWMRASGFSEAKVSDYERTARIGRVLFMAGPFGVFAALKCTMFGLVHAWKTIGMPPLFIKDIFTWTTKSTSLACENLMIAAEALGLNTCPMEGFDGPRLLKFLGLSKRRHQVVMVIAVGKKASAYVDTPQWRRPLESTVTIL